MTGITIWCINAIFGCYQFIPPGAVLQLHDLAAMGGAALFLLQLIFNVEIFIISLVLLWEGERLLFYDYFSKIKYLTLLMVKHEEKLLSAAVLGFSRVDFISKALFQLFLPRKQEVNNTLQRNIMCWLPLPGVRNRVLLLLLCSFFPPWICCRCSMLSCK